MIASPHCQTEHATAPDDLVEMLESQAAAMAVVGGALDDLAAAASLMAEAVRRGAVLHYAAAGSSGLMALADASELPGTFGIAQAQIAVHMAGGVPVNGVMPGDTEDDCGAARRAAEAIVDGDLAIVVSASGATPYALAFAETAKMRGAKVICLANIAGSHLLDMADVAIALPTAPEFVDGSTRLGAGTAQKVALNMMSTRMGILLGHIHDGLMVNLKPDNIKLRKRAESIVCRISGVSTPEAQRVLAQTNYDTKAATLVAHGVTVTRAHDLLDKHQGVLGACLAEVSAQNDAAQTINDFISKGDHT